MVKYLRISSYALAAASVLALMPASHAEAAAAPTFTATIAFDEQPAPPVTLDWTPHLPAPVVGGATTVGLFGSLSGFAKARTDRVSITVASLPESAADVGNVQLGSVLDAWNVAAGWELFTLNTTGSETDVIFTDTAGDTCPLYGACTGWEQFDSGWYRQCIVMLWPWETPTNTLVHELGHCLGFIDMTTTIDNNYRGVMSYGRDRTEVVLGVQDVDSLTAVGYRTATVEG